MKLNGILSSLGPTKSRVLELLLSKNLTANEIVSSLQIQVSAIRKHMDDLQKFGLVREEYVNEGVGRPKKYYAITDDGRDLFSSKYATTLDLVLKKLSESDVQDLPQSSKSLIRDLACNIGKQMNPTGESDRQHLESFVTALSDYGFKAHIDVDHDSSRASLAIISENCPLIKTARSNQKIVCHGIHDQIIKTALSAKGVALEECMAISGNRCRHVILLRKSGT